MTDALEKSLNSDLTYILTSMSAIIIFGTTLNKVYVHTLFQN